MKLRLLFALLLVAFISNAQSLQLTDSIPTDPKVKIGTLSNGMKYYIYPNALPEKKVEMRLVVKIGSIVEEENQRGVAHFMEHMNFNGTKHFPKNQLIDFLQKIGVKFGADLNAYTSFDETVYILPIPLDDPKNLDNGLTILEDWAFNALITPQDVEDERKIILEERRKNLGATSRMRGKIMPILYPDTKYAKRMPIGTEEVIKSCSAQELKDFYTTWYRPDLMAIIIVGDIKADEIEQKIIKQFSPYKNPANSKERKQYKLENHQNTIVAIATDKEFPQTIVQLSYRNPKDSSPNKTVADSKESFVQSIVSQLLNLRFNELATQKEPLLARAQYGTELSNKEAFTFSAISTPDKISSTLKRLKQEEERAKQYGFLDSELERLKKALLANEEQNYANRNKKKSPAFVNALVNNFLKNTPIISDEWEYQFAKEILPTITLEDINSQLKSFLHSDNNAVVINAPETTIDEKTILANLSEAVSVEAYQDNTADLKLLNTEPTPGKITSTETNNLLNTNTLQLSNGIKVVYKKTDFEDNEILMNGFKYGGSSLISDDIYNKTKYIIGHISGVKGIKNTDLTKLLLNKVVSFDTSIDDLSQNASGYASKEDLETLMQRIYLAFTQINDSKEELEIVKRQFQQMGAENFEKNPEYYFSNEFHKYLNQKDPRVGNLRPMPNDWENTDLDLAITQYKERMQNANGWTFFFVGNIEEEHFKNLVSQYIASIPTTSATENFKDRNINFSHAKTEEKIYKKGSEPKAKLRIVFEGNTQYSKTEDFAQYYLNDILEIRLNNLLREQKGGIYSINVGGHISKLPKGYYTLNFNLTTEPARVQEMKKLCFEELGKIAKKGVTKEEMEKVRTHWLTNREADLKTNGYWVSRLYGKAFAQENPEELLQYEEYIKKITSKDIKKLVKRYYLSHYTVGILLPEDAQK